MISDIKNEEKHVFYIDDDEDDLELFQLAIQDINPRLRYTCLSSASDALEILNQGTDVPNLVIVDLNMPRMNGFEFLKAFRRTHFATKPKIVVLTTSALESERFTAFTLGATDFVCKGDDYEGFRSNLQEVLSTYLS